MSSPQPPPSGVPLFTVVAGGPTSEELAALTVVLAGRRAARVRAARRAAHERGPASRWAHRADLVRAPLAPGPGAWRHSALPR